MLETTTQVRALTAEDAPALHELLDRDRLVNLFVRARVEASRMHPRWLGAEIWGYYEDDRLVSACHAGANIVPAEATPRAIEAFADRALRDGIRPSSIVGLRSVVEPMWQILEPHWGPARSPRLDQPFMVLEHDPVIAPDPRVRPVAIDELDLVYPSCVAMFTEEVGVDPEAGNRNGYRARVAQLIGQGWAFAIIEDGDVLFKTEVGAATPYACQLQGVYVRPDLRGQGIAAAAVAAVVQHVRAMVAPSVTLYVNHHNTPARRAYERVGFRQTETFASILF